MKHKIACIGVGNLGRAWAAIFARAGHEVALYDSQPDALKAALPVIESTLGSLASEGLVAATGDVMQRIRTCDSLDEALADAKVRDSDRNRDPNRTMVAAPLSPTMPSSAAWVEVSVISSSVVAPAVPV